MNSSIPPAGDGDDHPVRERTAEPYVLPADEEHAEGPQILVPVVLFLLTCWSTYNVGGLAFSVALMVTLLAHELGHYLQARRYGVPASLPYFLPMPFRNSLIGTLGAVIVMHPGMGNRKSLFDIAITGPIAGLVPALIFSCIGLSLSEVRPPVPGEALITLGEPLLFQWLGQTILGPLPAGQEIMLHPLGYAGWVGLFITALNLIPIGQLDGGHILYALVREKAHGIATLLLIAAAAAVVLFGYWGWSLMLMLLVLIGPVHPPTADDTVPLGGFRTGLGWITLLFVVIGFTPTPFMPAG